MLEHSLLHNVYLPKDIADVPLTDSPFVAWGDHEQTDPSTFKGEMTTEYIHYYN